LADFAVRVHIITHRTDDKGFRSAGPVVAAADNTQAFHDKRAIFADPAPYSAGIFQQIREDHLTANDGDIITDVPTLLERINAKYVALSGSARVWHQGIGLPMDNENRQRGTGNLREM